MGVIHFGGKVGQKLSATVKSSNRSLLSKKAETEWFGAPSVVEIGQGVDPHTCFRLAVVFGSEHKLKVDQIAAFHTTGEGFVLDQRHDMRQAVLTVLYPVDPAGGDSLASLEFTIHDL